MLVFGGVDSETHKTTNLFAFRHGGLVGVISLEKHFVYLGYVFFQTSYKSKSKILPFIRSWWCQRFRNVYLGIMIQFDELNHVESKSKHLRNVFFGYFCGFLDIKFCEGKKFEEETKRRRKVRDVFYFGGPLVVRWSGGPSKEKSAVLLLMDKIRLTS